MIINGTVVKNFNVRWNSSLVIMNVNVKFSRILLGAFSRGDVRVFFTGQWENGGGTFFTNSFNSSDQPDYGGKIDNCQRQL